MQSEDHENHGISMASSAFGISTSATGAPFFDAGASWPQGAEVTVSGSQKGDKKKVMQKHWRHWQDP